MRIALLAPLEHPLREPYAGGLEKHTVQLARGLSQRGHHVTLFAHPDTALIEGVDLQRAERGYAAVLKQLRTAGSYDVFHNNSLDYRPTLFAHRLPYPTVTTLHVPPYRRLRPGALLSRLITKSTFISISDYLATQWYPYMGGCPVIHNGIDLSEWTFGSMPAPKTAIWYGRISPEKAPHLAIEAAQLAGYRVSLAGPISDREYFDRQLAPLFGDEVIYLGHLGQAELAPHLSRAAVGLFTSVWDEPFGLVIPELLASGTPVAGFRSGAAPDLVDERVAVLVPTGAAPALAAAIPRAAALSRQDCRTYAATNFPLSRMIEAYETHYRSLLYL